MDQHMNIAIEQAEKSLSENGIPIGSVLVINDQVIGQGHNQRCQKNSVILHGEMDCLENAGRLSATEYAKATLYTTLSPCPMCSGTILLYGIKNVVIGENINFLGAEEHLKANGVNLTVLNDKKCIEMMARFISNHKALWFEDIGI